MTLLNGTARHFCLSDDVDYIPFAQNDANTIADLLAMIPVPFTICLKFHDNSWNHFPVTLVTKLQSYNSRDKGELSATSRRPLPVQGKVVYTELIFIDQASEDN